MVSQMQCFSKHPAVEALLVAISLLRCVHTDRLGFRCDNGSDRVSDLREKMGTVPIDI